MSLILGYLIGSIPIGYLYGRARGIDVRQVGFKRIGASNIYKTFGTVPGVLVFFGDFVKPIVAILVARLIGSSDSMAYVAGIFAILGHNWPVWLKFKGEGRGLASSMGFLYFLVPLETLSLFAVLFPICVWRNSTPLVAFIFFCATPFVVLLFPEPAQFFYLSLTVCSLILVTRLIGGVKAAKGADNKGRVLLNSLLFDRPEKKKS